MMKKYLLMLLISVLCFSVCFAEGDRAVLYTLTERVELQCPEEDECSMSEFAPRADMSIQFWDLDNCFCYCQSQFIYNCSELTIDDVYGIMIEGKDCDCCEENSQIEVLEKTDNTMLIRLLEIDPDGDQYVSLHHLILTDQAYHALTCSFFYFAEEERMLMDEARWCEVIKQAKIVQKPHCTRQG